MKKASGLTVFLHLLPLLAPFTLVFAAGLVFTLLQSLGIGLPPDTVGSMEPAGAVGNFSAYRAVLESEAFLSSLAYSLLVAGISALLSVLMGLFLAIALWRLPAGLKKYAVIYKIPLILPHITVGFIVLILFSQSGILSSLTHSVGITDTAGDFPNLFYNKTGSGIILSYLWKEIPFAALMTLSALGTLDTRYLQTGRMLGGSFFFNLKKLILPHVSPALHSSFIILFLYSFGAFEIPYLVGESSPQMLSITVYNLYFNRSLSSRPQAMAILTLMLLFSILFIVLYMRSVSGKTRELRRL